MGQRAKQSWTSRRAVYVRKRLLRHPLLRCLMPIARVCSVFLSLLRYQLSSLSLFAHKCAARSCDDDDEALPSALARRRSSREPPYLFHTRVSFLYFHRSFFFSPPHGANSHVRARNTSTSKRSPRIKAAAHQYTKSFCLGRTHQQGGVEHIAPPPPPCISVFANLGQKTTL